MKKDDLWIERRTWEWHTGETIDEAIRTYKCEVEKMNEKVEKLERAYM